MKALLIKDLRLMMAQKRFFLMVAGLAIVMAAMNNDVSFLMGFVTLIIGQFAVSTISYDEYDNGFAFLFTLPVGRRMYAAEKYALGLLLALAACVFSTGVSLIVTAVQGGPLTEVLAAGAAMLPAALLIQAFTIPFQLKYGGEKGRLVLMAVAGVIFVVIAGGSMLAKTLHFDLAAAVDGLSRWSAGLLLGGMLALTLAALAVSLRISMGVMEKKEF